MKIEFFVDIFSFECYIFILELRTIKNIRPIKLIGLINMGKIRIYLYFDFNKRSSFFKTNNVAVSARAFTCISIFS